jgi:hypothetical protein
MADDTPCSSNGDAAASLAAMLSASSIAPNAAPAAPPATADTPASAPAKEAKEERALPSDWRLKFLDKVGVTQPGGVPQEAPELSREGSKSWISRSNTESSVGSEGVSRADTGGSELREERVVVRQATMPRRSSDDIRLAYIKKLEVSRGFLPQLNRPKSSQTVTIFDWDDTLLCTTHLEMVQRQYGAIPVQVREQLASLERVVLSLLENAVKNGKAFIITNASEGWVQHSSSMCMPGLTDALSQVDIISARQGFEASFPGDSHAWKMHAFLQVSNKLQMEAVTNLISVGDSHIEMDAVHLLGRSFAHALVKTVKLWERPTPYELQKQLEVVAEKLPDIYRSGTTLNIWLERETTQGQPPQQ